MAEKIASENDQISNFKGLVTLTVDRVILHTIVHYSSTSTYMPNFIKIEESFVDGQTYNRRTYVHGHGWTFETNLIMSTLSKTQPKK